MCNTWVVCNGNNWCCAVLCSAIPAILLHNLPSVILRVILFGRCKACAMTRRLQPVLLSSGALTLWQQAVTLAKSA